MIAYQNEAGFWDASELGDEESVQATAYAIMALIAQRDADALAAAVKGSNWLVETQDDLGGWDPSSLGSDGENLEVDGEAAWALATALFPECLEGAKNHGQFVSCVAKFTRDLMKDGTITAEQREAIVEWAAQSDIVK